MGKKIDLTEVEAHILELDEEYGLEQITFDPWQMVTVHGSQRTAEEEFHSIFCVMNWYPPPPR